MPYTPTFHHGYVAQTGGDPANIFMVNCTHLAKSLLEQAFKLCSITQSNQSLTGPLSTTYFADVYDQTTGTGAGFWALGNQKSLMGLGGCYAQLAISTMLDTVSASITGAVNCIEQFFFDYEYDRCKPVKPLPIGEELGIGIGIGTLLFVVIPCIILTGCMLAILYSKYRNKEQASSSDETTPINSPILRSVSYDSTARKDDLNRLNTL